MVNKSQFPILKKMKRKEGKPSISSTGGKEELESRMAGGPYTNDISYQGKGNREYTQINYRADGKLAKTGKKKRSRERKKKGKTCIPR